MRWFWIDRYTEFVCGDRATAIKNISLAEEHLHDHFPAAPIMPNSLIVEGMAQTAGLLVSEVNNFQERVVLAKLAKSQFYFSAVPGQTLTYRVKIDRVKEDGAMVHTTSHVEDRLQSEAEIFFAHLDDRSAGKELFDTNHLLTWLKVLKVFDVGVRPDGSKLTMPATA